MFILNSGGDLNQIEFFQLYNVTFTPSAEASPFPAPADAIKPQRRLRSAQALLLPGPPQKFAVQEAKLPNEGSNGIAVSFETRSVSRTRDICMITPCLFLSVIGTRRRGLIVASGRAVRKDE